MTDEKARMTPDFNGGLDHYIRTADETTRDLLADGGPLVDALRKYDDYMRRDMWAHVDIKPGFGVLLSMNACTTFLAGVRTALGGHPAAVFPTLRTGLESAAYALLLEREPALSDVWAQRHRSETDLKACRAQFRFERALRYLKTKVPDIYDLATQGYEGAIDYGAHPNVRGVMGHVSIDEDREDDNAAVTLTALYGPSHVETLRGLCACLDFGLAIIGLIVLADPDAGEAAARDLQALSDLKNDAVDSYGDGE